jgi:hypothetical protein
VVGVLIAAGGCGWRGKRQDETGGRSDDEQFEMHMKSSVPVA